MSRFDSHCRRVKRLTIVAGVLVEFGAHPANAALHISEKPGAMEELLTDETLQLDKAVVAS